MSTSVKVDETTTSLTPVPDGSRFVLAAPETTRFPGEELPVLRALDSFVFLVEGKPIPLSNGWIQNTSWEGIEVVGAVASMTGPTAPLAQCGWITQMQWHWIRITTILRVEIRKDSRFRKGELGFWLVTSLGEYAILIPHRGYSTAWNEAISQPEVPTPVPTFHRMSDRDPIPTWWDPAWGVAWPPSTPGPTSGLKRAAPPVSKPNSTSSSTANPQQSALDGTRRVRRRRDSEVNLTERPTAMLEGELSTPAKPTAREAENESCTSGDPVKPELGVKMSRSWDVARDRIEKPPAAKRHKSGQGSKNTC